MKMSTFFYRLIVTLLFCTTISSSVTYSQFKYDFSTLKNEIFHTPYVSISEKGLVFTLKNDYYKYALPFHLEEDSYSFSVDFIITENQKNSGVGFSLLLEGGQEYRFLYYDKGKYYLSEKGNTDKEYTTITKWIEHAAIKKELNQKNTLEVEIKNGKIYFKINGKELHKKEITHPTKLGFIQIYNTAPTSFIIESISFSKEPKIRKVNLAKSNTSNKLTEFNTGINHPHVANVTPIVSADEKNIFFVRKEEKDRVYHARRRQNGTWEPARFVDTTINLFDKNKSILSTNTDATSVFVKGGSVNGKGVSGAITRFEKNAEGIWVEKEVRTTDKYKNKNQYQTQFLSNDEMYLFHCIDKEDGFGDQDVHVSIRKADGNYGEPINLGKTINSAGSESFAFLAPDNTTLYFSTCGLPGYGSNDIYMSRRLDDTWTNWTTPTNLGSVINSTEWDGYFSTSASGNMGIVASSNHRKKAGLFYFELSDDVKPEPVLIVKGTVTDKDSKLPISSNVTFNSLSGKVSKSTITNSEDGQYSIVLLKGEKYEIIAEEDGYYPVSEFIDLTNLDTYQEIQKNLQLAKIKAGQVIRLNNIFFEFGKANLMEESHRELDRLINLLNEQKSLKIELSGHTDAVGSAENNKILSQNRANSVMEYLTSKGIPANRLTAKGYGKTQPVAENDTEEGRALNRRVEFKIM
jgi:OmpA-OmpF porin, OOP family